MKKIFLLISFIIFIYAENIEKEPIINSTNIIGDTVNMLKSKDPKSEYLLGIDLATSIIKDEIYPVNHKKVIYLKNILNNLVLSSETPYVFDGYKIILVKNNTINAFALPGGIIIIHDGLFNYLKNEDQFAAILGHEIGHIQEKHSIESNRSSLISDIAKVGAALTLVKKVENNIIQNLAFGISSKITNSIENGYNVDMEAAADAIGINIMYIAGYDPNEFLNLLNILKDNTNDYGGANYPEDRYIRLEKIIKTLKLENTKNEVRLRRYESIK